MSCSFLDSKQTSRGFLDVQNLAYKFLANITMSSGYVENILLASVNPSAGTKQCTNVLLARIGNISSEGDLSANEGAQSGS